MINLNKKLLQLLFIYILQYCTNTINTLTPEYWVRLKIGKPAAIYYAKNLQQCKKSKCLQFSICLELII